ncbi:transcription initiation factor tfiid 55 kda subunit [Moniliophthora roreri MCA 2997]|uniref:Transcription initiation factor tfiid 55 kDa subunit n=2 Tax=Moniliophthora roreri TaxID=221103 RepID=V2WK16_MONRO|nr:transcription initiation factor tfiid 55 kda subunit [Moniliophthora roreri MCA 2997]KAI3607604.1 transcription initiation factor tfiid 55 kda subunit [Moniliophthora roreri]
MDEDLIVVDDVEELAQESTAGLSSHHNASDSDYAQPIPSSAPSGSRTSSRLRNNSQVTMAASDTAERTTRFQAANANKSKVQPKLKLKLSEKAAAQAPGMSFLGQYDRELDSDEEELAFEEQFILRMPAGEDCEKLRKIVASREVPNDVWFKFKDSRRAVFYLGNNSYSSKLVDLPCIIESQKTLDNKQMFKVADICQMLVVEDRIENEADVSHSKVFNIEDFIWPHGITPPLHHVRKRRFRKRINKRTIESVEQEVERLLEADNMASEIKYEVLDNVNPDLSDSEFIEREEPIDAPTPAISDTGDAPTPGDMNEGEEEGEGGGDEEEPEGDIDEELAAELDLALGDEEEADEEDDDDDESEEEEDDDDDDDDSQARKLLNEEIRDLEAAVAKKNSEIASSANPLIRKRFEDALKKLTADLEMKQAQRDELKEKQRMKKEGITLDGDPDSDSDAGDNPQNGVSVAEDDLFGGDQDMDMDQ